MAIEIVDFPIKNGGSFHSYVKLPEGIISWIFSRNKALDHINGPVAREPTVENPV